MSDEKKTKTFISKSISVEAFQYAGGDWRVTYADGNLRSMSNDQFLAAFDEVVEKRPFIPKAVPLPPKAVPLPPKDAA